MVQPRLVLRATSIGLMALSATTVLAQDYPSKPVRIVTGSVGGGNDQIARQIAQGIAGPLGQPVIVDNRGVGALPMEAVFKQPPDGYTMLLQGASLWLLPLLQKTSYDALRDFAPVTLISKDVNVLVVHPSLPVKSVKDLIALAKSRPGELNYGSTTAGAPQFLGLELFKSMAGVNIVNVSYKGIAPALTALLSGEIQVLIGDPGLVAPHVKQERLRALAVTSAKPSALAPGLPPIAATGLPGYEWIGMTLVVIPSKTPTPIITRLNQEIVRYLNRPEVKERFLNSGTEIVGSSPDELAAVLKADTAKAAKLLKDAGIRNE
jgi:tripartite-type tricarboxylate transporter receptor subunit TctC